MRRMGWLVLSMTMVMRAQIATPSTKASPEPTVSSRVLMTGSVRGTVTDIGGALVPDAHVELSPGTGSKATPLVATTDKAGRFNFSDVAAGSFTLTVTSEGLQPIKMTGAVSAGGVFEVPLIAMRVAITSSDVQVTFTQEELGVEEVREMEKQRVFGVIPNFYTVYDWKAPPMTTKQKYDVAFKITFDPVSLLLTGASAGIEQATNTFPSYGQGAAGYGKRFAAAFGTNLFGTFLSGAVFPQIFHQDPRYFWKGTGTKKQRTLYALEQAVVCRSDKDGHTMVNYSNILGSLVAGGLANAYYPAASRQGASLTLESAGLGLVFTGLGNIFQEFLLHRLTPSVAKTPPSQP